MSRISYVDPANATPEQAKFCSELLATRGRLTNFFLALANAPDFGRGVLAMATSLRTSRHLSRVYRELAIVAVGMETGATYELAHHWNAALKEGISEDQLREMGNYLHSPLFDTEQRAVISYAVASTRSIKVADEVWNAVAFLTDQSRQELVLTVAWYNCVARMAEAMEIDFEAWEAMPALPPMP